MLQEQIVTSKTTDNGGSPQINAFVDQHTKSTPDRRNREYAKSKRKGLYYTVGLSCNHRYFLHQSTASLWGVISLVNREGRLEIILPRSHHLSSCFLVASVESAHWSNLRHDCKQQLWILFALLALILFVWEYMVLIVSSLICRWFSPLCLLVPNPREQVRILFCSGLMRANKLVNIVYRLPCVLLLYCKLLMGKLRLVILFVFRIITRWIVKAHDGAGWT